MTGSRHIRNPHVGIVLQERDRHLLSELAVMRIVDREKTKIVAGFGSTTQVNTRLLELTRAGLLRRFFIGSIGSGRKAIYTLSPKGADLVSAKLGGIQRASGRLVVGDRFVEHQTGINEVYLILKYGPIPHPGVQLRRWLQFRQSISEAIKLTPDAYFELGAGDTVRAMFLEVDLGTEALKVWQQKTAYYLQLAVSGEFTKRFRQPQFRVLVVAHSEKRLSNIRSTIAKSTDKIFWFTTLDIINRDGFWSPIWLRPTGDQRHSLI
jgi:protein involved in plasmid replication-relaxation